MWVEFFVDPVSAWTYRTSPLLAEIEPRADEGHTGAGQRPARQGLLVRLLGRMGAWFGVCEQAPSGAWQAVHIPRRDPSEPSARHTYGTVWSWWCP
jgi:hypothetical protein